MSPNSANRNHACRAGSRSLRTERDAHDHERRDEHASKRDLVVGQRFRRPTDEHRTGAKKENGHYDEVEALSFL